MCVLFDQGTPVSLRNFLGQHQITTAYELGWGRLTNGDLLASAGREGFDVLVATDKNMVHQQNMLELPFAIVVLSTTSWPRILIASDAVVHAIDSSEPGNVTELDIP